jgi:hypothetical protein
MKPKLILCLALVLSGVLTGYVTHREFSGSTANLKGAGDQTSNANDLKMSVEGSGITTNGGNYIIFSLPQEHCHLVLFYPKMKPYPYYYFRADLGTNQIHGWQIEQSDPSPTNHIVTHINLAPNQTDVWFKRGKTFNRSELKSGIAGGLPADAERLYGQVEMIKDGGEFHITVDLSNENGVKLLGILDSYKEPWPPLVYPFLIIFAPFMKD